MNNRDKMDRLFKEAILRKIKNAVFATALQVDRELVNETPVDTGRARANWLPSINSPRTETVGESNAESPLNLNYKLGDTIYIANNLPYIRRLNDGHSQQAPAGFVDKIIQRARSSVKDKFK